MCDVEGSRREGAHVVSAKESVPDCPAMEDRSLDDFLQPTDESDADGDSTTADETAAEAGDAPEAESDPHTPATPTFRYVRSGTCPACGTATARLWRDGEQFVCVDCKEF
jgi:hypothetical protein